MNARVRQALIKVYKQTCQYCLKKMPELSLEVDHIDPVSRGGPDSFSNIILACYSCNSRKSDLYLEEPGRSLLLSIAKNNVEYIMCVLQGKSYGMNFARMARETISLDEITSGVKEGYVQMKYGARLWLPVDLAESEGDRLSDFD